MLQWQDHLTPDERAELARLDDQQSAISASRRRIRKRAWGRAQRATTQQPEK